MDADLHEKLEAMIDAIPDKVLMFVLYALLDRLDNEGLGDRVAEDLIERYVTDVLLDEGAACDAFDALMTKDPDGPAKARALLGEALGRFHG